MILERMCDSGKERSSLGCHGRDPISSHEGCCSLKTDSLHWLLRTALDGDLAIRSEYVCQPQLLNGIEVTEHRKRSEEAHSDFLLMGGLPTVWRFIALIQMSAKNQMSVGHGVGARNSEIIRSIFFATMQSSGLRIPKLAVRRRHLPTSCPLNTKYLHKLEKETQPCWGSALSIPWWLFKVDHL